MNKQEFLPASTVMTIMVGFFITACALIYSAKTRMDASAVKSYQQGFETAIRTKIGEDCVMYSRPHPLMQCFDKCQLDDDGNHSSTCSFCTDKTIRICGDMGFGESDTEWFMTDDSYMIHPLYNN